MPGLALPAVGPVGIGSPPFRSVPKARQRYYAQLRLPSNHPKSLRVTLAPWYLVYSTYSLIIRGKHPHDTRSVVKPVNQMARRCTRRTTALPSSRATPMDTCPALRPRWCSGTRHSAPGTAAFHTAAWCRLSHVMHAVIPMDHNIDYFGVLQHGLHPRYTRLQTPCYQDARGFTTDRLAKRWSGGN